MARVRSARSGVVTVIVLVATALMLTTGARAVGPPGFVATDLGTLGGTTSFPLAMSNSGVAVGYSDTAGSLATHAFRWTRDSGMTDLGTLGGDYSLATAVNERGMVAGASRTAGNALHAFTWSASSGMIDLGTLGSSFAGSYATGINANGLVIGTSWKTGEDFSTHGFAWTPSTGMVDIGSFGGDTFPNAVNEWGLVVGISYRAGNTEARPFAWTRTGGLVDLGSLGGRFGEALAVSETGFVVGYSYTGGTVSYPHPFLWTARSGMIDLGAIGNGNSGYARSVNDFGVVAGYGSTQGSDVIHGFIGRPGKRLKDLGATNGESYTAGINDDSLVVGNNYTADGQGQLGFAWTREDGMIELPAAGGQPYSQVEGVTIDGTAFGFSYDFGAGHATIWKPKDCSC